jgi:hypothetical protein
VDFVVAVIAVDRKLRHGAILIAMNSKSYSIVSMIAGLWRRGAVVASVGENWHNANF